MRERVGACRGAHPIALRRLTAPPTTHSWGWESFAQASSLTARDSWTTGDSLRFLVSLDLV